MSSAVALHGRGAGGRARRGAGRARAWPGTRTTAERLAALVAAVDEGEVDGEDAETLEELLELGLQSGRIRALYGPGGEQAALVAVPPAAARRGRRRERARGDRGAARARRASELRLGRARARSGRARSRSRSRQASSRSPCASTGRARALVERRCHERAAREAATTWPASTSTGAAASSSAAARSALEKAQRPARLRRARHRRRAADRAGARAPAGALASQAATEPADLDGRFLVVAATPIALAQPARLRRRRGARRCSATSSTSPELCSFILPAVYRRDPIALAVSTGGASPALAQRLRDELGARIGARARRPRRARCARCGPGRKRTQPTATRTRRDAARLLRGSYVERSAGLARVSVTGCRLVGAGPGDPGLITARGLELVRALRRPRLRPARRDELVDEAPARRDPDRPRAARAGRDQPPARALRPARPRRRPAEGRRPVRLRPRRRGGARARRGRRPVRGRPRRLVARSAVPAAAGIPVTHRGVSSQVTIVNGQGPLDFAALAADRRARSSSSWASRRLDEIAAGLVEHGRDPATPAAVISGGTTARRSASSSPRSIAIAGAAAELDPPALVVVGDVVAHSPRADSDASSRRGSS